MQVSLMLVETLPSKEGRELYTFWLETTCSCVRKIRAMDQWLLNEKMLTCVLNVCSSGRDQKRRKNKRIWYYTPTKCPTLPINVVAYDKMYFEWTIWAVFFTCPNHNCTMWIYKIGDAEFSSCLSNPLFHQHVIDPIHLAWLNFEQVVSIRLLANIALHNLHW